MRKLMFVLMGSLLVFPLLGVGQITEDSLLKILKPKIAYVVGNENPKIQPTVVPPIVAYDKKVPILKISNPIKIDSFYKQKKVLLQELDMIGYGSLVGLEARKRIINIEFELIRLNLDIDQFDDDNYLIEIENSSYKRIKYVILKGLQYNAVDDVIGEYESKFTGPFECGESYNCTTYRSCSKLKITSVDVIYFDSPNIITKLNF